MRIVGNVGRKYVRRINSSVLEGAIFLVCGFISWSGAHARPNSWDRMLTVFVQGSAQNQSMLAYLSGGGHGSACIVNSTQLKVRCQGSLTSIAQEGGWSNTSEFDVVLLPGDETYVIVDGKGFQTSTPVLDINCSWIE